MLGADEPPEVTIEMHLEMSYNRDMPARIYFYCHKVHWHPAPQSLARPVSVSPLIYLA